MNKKDAEFRQKLKAIFKVEADEHIKTISAGIIELEKNKNSAEQGEIIETVFREAHSLKGAARSVNMTSMEEVCKYLEDIFAAMQKTPEELLAPKIFELLHQALKCLTNLLLAEEKESPGQEATIKGLIKDFELFLDGSLPGGILQDKKRKESLDSPVANEETSKQLVDKKNPVFSETVRITTSKLDSLLLQTEELLAIKQTIRQRVVDFQEINDALSTLRKQWNLNSKTADFLEAKLAGMIRTVGREEKVFGSMIDNLIESTRKVSMLSFSAIFNIFPIIVRELSQEQEKDVELVTKGEDIEIDKRILEEIKDPLIHLIRNCIDHGIEKPEEREKKNKNPRGKLTILVSLKSGSKVEILVFDDGAGINVDKIKAVAVKQGILSEEEAKEIEEQEALSLVFQSGLTSSPMITDISGRGLGLAIVKEKVEKLGGVISLKTDIDAGTSFSLLLPLTLATFRGVIVSEGGQLFILPTASVEYAAKVAKEAIKTVENIDTIQLGGETVATAHLGSILEIPPSKDKPGDASDYVQVVLVQAMNKRIAFLVDEVLSEEEMLLKRLGRQLSRVRNISGVTVLSTGVLAPVLNVPDLMKSAVVLAPASSRGSREATKGAEKKKTILIAEDSITSRTLLTNIIKSAGYDVQTAVDGAKALTILKKGTVDLVVSDIEMPEMNGFELTSAIRNHEKLTDLPVVLVTSLSSPKDKAQGVDVGANAYIVKSSFDESNLLDIIRGLI